MGPTRTAALAVLTGLGMTFSSERRQHVAFVSGIALMAASGVVLIVITPFSAGASIP